MKESIQKGALAYLPKSSLGNVVLFLEDVLTYEYGDVWRSTLKNIEGIFSKERGPYWQKPDEDFWKKFEEKIGQK